MPEPTENEHEEPEASEQTEVEDAELADDEKATKRRPEEAFGVVIAFGRCLAEFRRIGRSAELAGYRVVGIASSAAGA